MKKNIIVGTALAIGLLSVGTMSAFAADYCGGCADKQAMHQFSEETAALRTALENKTYELRQITYYADGRSWKESELEADIKALKDKISASAARHGMTACNK